MPNGKDVVKWLSKKNVFDPPSMAITFLLHKFRKKLCSDFDSPVTKL